MEDGHFYERLDDELVHHGWSEEARQEYARHLANRMVAASAEGILDFIERDREQRDGITDDNQLEFHYDNPYRVDL